MEPFYTTYIYIALLANSKDPEGLIQDTPEDTLTQSDKLCDDNNGEGQGTMWTKKVHQIILD